MYIVLSDETERRLRLAVVTILGGKKGDLSSAIEVAIKEWLDKHPQSNTLISGVGSLERSSCASHFNDSLFLR